MVTSHGLEKKTEWNIENKPVHTNVFKDGTEMKKYIITVQKKLNQPRVEQMDFEYLINKVQEKKLLAISGRAFPYIKRVKGIRNKVHLQIGHGTDITDYKSINYEDYILTKYILYKILTDTKLCVSSSGVYDFIKLSSSEKNIFDKDVNDETIKAIAQKQPYYFVMRDSSLANDSVATNFEQIFATYSPDTVRKVL